MAVQTIKPKAEKASLRKLGTPTDITPRGEGVTDIRNTPVWIHASSNFVEGNLGGRYEGDPKGE